MNIKTLNNKEDRLVKKYQEVYLKSMISAINKKGLSKSAIALHRKTMKRLSKEMANSGLGLGTEWLNSRISNRK